MQKRLAAIFGSLLAFLLALPAHAQLLDNLGSAGETGFGASQPKPIAETVAAIINSALGLLGIIVVALMVYAGFLWMTARGNEQNIEKAREILTQCIIGAIILLTSYAITRFVVNSLVAATT